MSERAVLKLISTEGDLRYDQKLMFCTCCAEFLFPLSRPSEAVLEMRRVLDAAWELLISGDAQTYPLVVEGVEANDWLKQQDVVTEEDPDELAALACAIVLEIEHHNSALRQAWDRVDEARQALSEAATSEEAYLDFVQSLRGLPPLEFGARMAKYNLTSESNARKSDAGRRVRELAKLLVAEIRTWTGRTSASTKAKVQCLALRQK